ncbi:GAF domain-containing protein [Kineosporia sp. J2-2]|uniref:GAF domain-containing protein n=1 Tax=Kineosporia corallincola TaxID=2835133 RepID=A0ABS5TR74_9ACTN|nr:GAF domain-containing protein [Kineosporia corallincola]MBT0772794.1 GAF domain-containing protein [Kineosporia corallincola]
MNDDSDKERYGHNQAASEAHQYWSAGQPPPLPKLGLERLLQELIGRSQEIIDTEQQLHRLLDAVIAVASDLSLPDTLRRITQLAADLAEAKYAALGLLGPDGVDLVDFITVGIPGHQRAKIGDPPRGRGILGVLIDLPVPLRLDNLGDHPASTGFPAHHPPMGSFLGVPLRVRGEVFGNLYLTEKRDGGTFTERDEQLIVALAAAAGIAIENSRLFDVTRRREAWLTAAGDVTKSLLAGAETEETMRLVVERASTVAGGGASFLLLNDADGSLSIRAAHGENTAVLLGTTYQLDQKRLSERQAFLTEGIVDGPGISERFGGPSVLVPLVVGNVVIGALAIVRPPRAEPYSEADMHMVESFAGHAALAVQFSRQAADRQRLAVLEDRDRIARDLHDLVIQRIFAVGLGLQSIGMNIDNAAQSSKLSGLIDDLDTTIHAIRTSIFSLQQQEDESTSLRSEALGVVTEATSALGFEPVLTFRGPVDTLVPAAVYADLLAVLREALSNAARHAHATHVEVRLSVDAGQVTLEVEDDGSGVATDAKTGTGTTTMRTRAERHGGSCGLSARDDGASGTVVVWQVPVN